MVRAFTHTSVRSAKVEIYADKNGQMRIIVIPADGSGSRIVMDIGKVTELDLK